MLTKRPPPRRGLFHLWLAKQLAQVGGNRLDQRRFRNRQAQLAARVDTLIVTRGAEGSIVWQKGTEQTIAPVPAAAVKDPTGCGDAYRAGLLLAMATGRSLLDGARLGSVLGSIKIAVQGCQNHRPTREEIRAQFEQHYGAWPF